MRAQAITARKQQEDTLRFEWERQQKERARKAAQRAGALAAAREAHADEAAAHAPEEVLARTPAPRKRAGASLAVTSPRRVARGKRCDEIAARSESRV